MEITINGKRAHYQVYGEGKPFLILHGWGSNTERWAEVAELLSRQGLQVIIPDLPGFGATEAPETAWNTNNYVTWVDAFIAQLQLKDFYLLGHSFGGALSCKIAIKHNQDIKKLFLVAAAYVREKTVKKSVLARVAKIIKIFNFIPYYNLFRKAVYKFILRKSDYAYVDGVMKETYLKIVAEDMSFQIPFIKVPTVIIWGDKDEATPIDDAYYIQQHIKNSQLEVIANAGHDLNRKQADLLAEKIRKHI